MAWPWLTLAVKTIPWTTIVRRAPDIIDAASSLLTTRKANQAAKHVATQTETQLSEIRERLDYLEDHDKETAKVVNQIAEQTQAIANGMEILAAKIRLLSFALGATLIAIVVIAFAVL
jgi:uncharacterized protein (DUF3084 family)